MKKLLLALALCSPLMILSQAMAVQPLGTDVKLAFEVEESKLLPPKLDIVFVIDDSASMSVMQNQLAAAMNRLSGTFDNSNADIHAAVTTSTMTELDGPGCKFSATKACDGRFNKGFLSNSEPNFSAELAERLLVGTLGGGTEAFFEPVLLALQTPLRHPENAGFLRSDAKLVVVMLTDADDQSNRSATEFARSLVALKSGDTSLVHLITSTVPLGENTRSCSRNGEPAAFKIDEAAKLLNAKRINICDPDMGEQVGEAILELRGPIMPVPQGIRSFKLPAVPEFSTLKVSFGNKTLVAGDVLAGWTYRSNSNRVLVGDKFDYSSEAKGTKLVIEFVIAQ